MHLPVWNVEHVENLVGVLVLNDAGSNPDRITLAIATYNGFPGYL